jgi:hypothetical protein
MPEAKVGNLAGVEDTSAAAAALAGVLTLA